MQHYQRKVAMVCFSIFVILSTPSCRQAVGRNAVEGQTATFAEGLTAASDAVEASPKPKPPVVNPIVERRFITTFNVNAKNFASSGRNTFFILEPGFQLQYDGEKGATQTISVLDETKVVEGVETRVVEKRELEDGKLSTLTRGYYVIDRSNNDVYCFGEDIDDYEDGKLTGHEGAWLSGKDNGHFGLEMPGSPEIGQRYYQSQVPKVAMDRAEILSLNNKVVVPAGTFDNCLKTEEASDLNTTKDINYYAPNVGLVTDGEYRLTKYGTVSKKE